MRFNSKKNKPEGTQVLRFDRRNGDAADASVAFAITNVPRPRKIRRAHFILSSDERGTTKRQLTKLDLCGACKKTSSVDLCLLAKRQSKSTIIDVGFSS